MMNTMKTGKGNLTKTLIVFLLALPLAPAFAQTTEEVPPVSAPLVADVAQDKPAAQETIAADTLIQTQMSSTLGNTASSTQETIAADTLIQTQDPSMLLVGTASSTIPFTAGTTTVAILPTPDAPLLILNATSTVATDTTPIVDQASTTDAVPLTPDVQTPEVAVPDTQVVATIAATEIAPKSSFKFAIRSARIATERVPEWQKDGDAPSPKDGKQDQIAPAFDTSTVTLDSTLGVPVIAGSCSNVFYVILLYKNQTDYSHDPASYILNKAYPCVGGAYSFAVEDLPESIPSGTYYLLVGEMGNKGSWTPVTSLAPIDISH